jgi:hypothetical protein
VAFFAVGDDHFRRVRLVALHAQRKLAVNTVAGGTLNGTMLASVDPELINLRCMTGNAGTLYVRKGNVQGRVRIPVATETTLKFEVSLPRLQMALVALLDRLCRSRWMAQMTSNARDGPVFTPCGLYLICRSGMTILAALLFWFRQG